MPDVAEVRRRTWVPGRPVDVLATLGPLRRGAHDPTWRVDPDGTLWRGVRTPEGPATLRLSSRPALGEVAASAWGPGATWLLDSLPALLGAGDDVSGFVPRHPRVVAAGRMFSGWRVPRTGLVVEALVPTVLEQKVTGQEAYSAWRRLVRRHGEPAPGAEGRLWVAPAAVTWGRIPSWAWLQAGVDGARSATVVRSVRAAGRLEECVDLDRVSARRRLRAVPGVGVWTTAEVAQRALGDADAVSFGDYHVAKDVGWALTGQEVDDDGLAELLEPYAGHRYRVQRLLELSGAMRPRRGPRMPPRRHLPVGRSGSRLR
ncbi:DNA-3-methyladenine glycosylase family protein [Segeticoccus rhizosphaerae]|jgi:3-methyladenine DNA glycosylase/8-oxoguanine DNA glycosylase|uniref:DNA-3-methyladenine glycosylase family protein n=2 Tax=Segeticoccus rhizosphaerae TaxID=1104777 RepID=UPI0010C130A2|nr:DNA-3-methyladenine glycosylase 2 family protein [Ornithinicoccus soli]